MAGEIIRKGDPTDHGGKVLKGSLADICHGMPIAYMGHKVFCPRCKGTFPIIEGVPTTTVYGNGVAVAGMKTACGATLVATQFTDVVEVGARSASRAAKPGPIAYGVTPATAVADNAVGLVKKSNDPKAKKITAIHWSFGEGETPISSVSRFYVDLNLHVQTENYLPGEFVDITIEDDQGEDVIEGVKKVILRAEVDAVGRAKLTSALAGRTVMTVH